MYTPPRPPQREQSMPVTAMLAPAGRPSGAMVTDGESSGGSPDGRSECGSATTVSEPAGI